MLLIIGIIVAVFMVANEAYVSIRGGCDERNKQLQSAASSVEDHLNAISINSSMPSHVEAWKDGDCLTGHGAVGTADFFSTSFLNTTEANAQVIKSLHSPTIQKDQSFILGDPDGDNLVDFVQTKLINGGDNETYEVNYYLTDKMACPDHEYESNICVKGESPDNYMSKPINKIQLSLREAAS